MGLSPFSKSSYDDDGGKLIHPISSNRHDVPPPSPPRTLHPEAEGPDNAEVLRRKLPPNPVPTNFQFVRTERVGNFLLVEVLYPDCTNYEGRKILVYDGISLMELLAQGSVDPHFSNNPKFHSPIARFVPTEEGWKMAKTFAQTWNEGWRA